MKLVTNEMLAVVIQKIQAGHPPTIKNTNLNSTLVIAGTPISTPTDDLTLALMGRLQSPETPTEIAKLNSALTYLSSDTEYGDGKFYTNAGEALKNYWLAAVWAIASLKWPSGKEIARSWSKQSARYDDDSFEKAWNSYNPSHEKALGIGSLYKRAKELGWNQGSTLTQSNANNLPQPTAAKSLQQRFALYDASGEIWVIDLEQIEKIKSGVSNEDVAFYTKTPAEIKMKRFLEGLAVSSDPKTIISQFWTSPKTIEFKGLAFSPLSTPPDILNFWVNSLVEPKQGDWSKVRLFIEEIICNCSIVCSEYVINFLAHMLQQPEKKPGIIVVLLGSQGTGKGTFFNLLRKIWSRTTLQVNDVEHVVGNFNAALEQNYVVCMDEALFVGERKKLERLKSLITEPVFRIKQKYQPSRNISSFHRFFAASNSEQFAHIEKDDRRFVFLKVSDSQKCNSEYFDAIHKVLDDEAVISAMVYGLLQIDLSSFNPRLRPKTNEHINQKLQSLDGFERYWFEALHSKNLGCVDSSLNDWSEARFMSTESLTSSYKSFNKNADRYGVFQSRDIAKSLKKLCPSAKKDKGKGRYGKEARGYSLPQIDIARGEFESAIGGVIDWGDGYESDDE